MVVKLKMVVVGELEIRGVVGIGGWERVGRVVGRVDVGMGELLIEMGVGDV